MRSRFSSDERCLICEVVSRTVESLLGLFLSAFLAATLVPFSSEALLAALVAADTIDQWMLFVAASTGNTLGSVANWCLGRYALHWQDRRWFPFKAGDLERAGRWFNRYGLWALLLAWVPIIGDPLTFAAGVLRTSFPLFLSLVAISKATRYLLVLGLVELAWP